MDSQSTRHRHRTCGCISSCRRRGLLHCPSMFAALQHRTWRGRGHRNAWSWSLPVNMRLSLQLPGHVLYRSTNVAVAEETQRRGAPNLHGQDTGWLFSACRSHCVCLRKANFLRPLLTDVPHPVTLNLESSHGPMRMLFFCRARAHLELAGRDSEAVPLTQQRMPAVSRENWKCAAPVPSGHGAYLDSP